MDDILAREAPGDPKSAFVTSRRWRKDNWFVGGVLGMKASLLTYGQKLVPADKTKKKEFAAWLAEGLAEYNRTRGTNQMMVEKYIATSRDEFLLQDNLVSFWRDAGEYPFPLQCERCDYKDVMGREVMKVRLGYTTEDLKAAGFSPAEIKRYADGCLVLDATKGEYYQVLTRAMVGQANTGFDYPRLCEVFRACSQSESMEVGESLYAYVGRCVIRMHHLGWEVKASNGVRQTDAMWDKVRADAIERKCQDGQMAGVKNMTANFDHKISYIWTDPKNYDAKKWESVIARLQWWGGPLVFLLTSRTLNPALMPLLTAEIKDLRALLKPHLEYVLNEAMDAPGGIKIEWTDECFTDMRLLWDMIKTLMQQGPASLTSGLRFAGLDPEVEGENKSEEAKPENEKKLAPLFVTPGGQGNGAQRGGGRTPTVKDGQGKKD